MTGFVIALLLGLIVAFMAVCVICEREDQKNREKK